MSKHHVNYVLSDTQRDLVTRNVALAYWHAAHLARKTCLDRDECDAEALHALCDAARCYDPTRGIRFSTYATWSIRQRLWRFQHCEMRRADRLAVRWTRGNVDEPGVDGRHRCDALTANELLALAGKDEPILRQRFLEGLLLAEIGARLGVSKERARQRQNAGLARVRKTLAARGHFG